MNRIIGNKLKTLRKSKGLKQEQVADYLKLSQSAYARIENGESHSCAYHIDKISELFEIEIDDLLKHNTVITNLSQNDDHSNDVIIINQLSAKLIEILEKQLEEKDLKILELEKVLFLKKSKL